MKNNAAQGFLARARRTCLYVVVVVRAEVITHLAHVFVLLTADLTIKLFVHLLKTRCAKAHGEQCPRRGARQNVRQTTESESAT